MIKHAPTTTPARPGAPELVAERSDRHGTVPDENRHEPGRPPVARSTFGRRAGPSTTGGAETRHPFAAGRRNMDA